MAELTTSDKTLPGNNSIPQGSSQIIQSTVNSWENPTVGPTNSLLPFPGDDNSESLHPILGDIEIEEMILGDIDIECAYLGDILCFQK